MDLPVARIVESGGKRRVQAPKWWRKRQENIRTERAAGEKEEIRRAYELRTGIALREAYRRSRRTERPDRKD